MFQYLRLSSDAKADATTGEMLNLLDQDAVRYLDFMNLTIMVWKAPIQIAVAFYLLWTMLGISTLAGFTSLLLISIVQYFIIRLTKKLEVRNGYNKFY